jgi:hypothetical protein
LNCSSVSPMSEPMRRARSSSHSARSRCILDGTRRVDLSRSGQARADTGTGFVEDHRGRSGNQDQPRVTRCAGVS